MVQKSTLSNLVTKSDNAKTGHQIRHCQIWGQKVHLTSSARAGRRDTFRRRPYWAYIHACELEAGKELD